MFKKCVVYLGYINDKNEMFPSATAFLVNIDNYFHLVTAKHTIFDKKTDSLVDDNMYIFYNGINGELQGKSIKMMKQNSKLCWIFHENRDVDVAIIPFDLHEDIDDVRFVPNSYFQGVDQLHETFDVYFLSYQQGIVFKNRISPVIRAGIISSIGEDKTFYIDAPAFPGNSGGPVFLQPSLQFGQNITTIGGGKLVGVIGEYVRYRDRAYSKQTGDLRVIFEENTDLSKVWGVSFINDIVNSKEFTSQITKIKEMASQ